MKTKQGFTLIELLVVVLIIGILSAVALPQYTKAVEKARLSEALSNGKVLTNAIDIFLLENGGFPAVSKNNDELGLSIQVGTFENNVYRTSSKYNYSLGCSTSSCYVDAMEDTGTISLVWKKESIDSSWEQNCYTYQTNLGQSLCNNLKSMGWKYLDEDW